MSNLAERELLRLRYRQGQMLRSSDFHKHLAVEAQLRWWHARSAHNAFGVIEGFDATLQGQVVTIQPGVAYDCFGRETVLRRAVSLPLPDKPREMTLLVQYRETSLYPNQNDIVAACLPSDRALFQPHPVFMWKATASVRIQDGVPLAKIPKNAGTPPRLEIVAPPARALAGARIAHSTTIPGSTAWELWTNSSAKLDLTDIGASPVGLAFTGEVSKPEPTETVNEFLFGLQVQIDTSAAGFTKTPCYFAWLCGPLYDQGFAARFTSVGDSRKRRTANQRLLQDLRLLGQELQLVQQLALHREHIYAPTPHGFTFRMWLPYVAKKLTPDRADQSQPLSNIRTGEALETTGEAQDLTGQLLALTREQQLCICWLGIQAGCKEFQKIQAQEAEECTCLERR